MTTPTPHEIADRLLALCVDRRVDGLDLAALATGIEREILRAQDDQRKAWDKGFEHALYWYGIWKDGVQRIGCQETPIKEATPMDGKRESDLDTIRS